MTDTNQRYYELQELCDRIKAAKPEAQALIETIGIAITAAATSAREKALQEAAELCRLPVPAASDVSADYLAGRYDAADEVRLAILSLIAGCGEK